MSQERRRSTMTWIIIGLVAIRVISIIALLNSDLDSNDTILGGDARRYQQIVFAQGTPYRDFDVEYPPATLAILKLVVEPSLEMTHLRLAVSQLALELATAAALAWGFSKRTAVIYLALGTPAVLFPFPYMRNDLLAVFLATLAIAAIRRHEDTGGGISLAVATFAKIWPLVIAPVLIVERRIRGLAAWALTGVVGLASWVAWAGTGGISQTGTFRGARGWQIESIPGAVIHLLDPRGSQMEQGAWRTGVAVATPLRTALTVITLVAIVGIWWIAARNRRGGGPAHVVFGIAPLACITALLCLSTIISPQYILWFIPFSAIAVAAGERTIGWLTLAIVALSTLVLATIHAQIEGRIYAMAPLLIRNGLLIALTIVAVRRLATRDRTATASLCA